MTDLTGYTWRANEKLNITESTTYEVNFVSNDEELVRISLSKSGSRQNMSYETEPITLRQTEYSGTDELYFWSNVAYREVLFTGGTDVTNANLISWLESNGSLVKINPHKNALLKANNQNLYPQTSVENIVDMDLYYYTKDELNAILRQLGANV